MVTIFGTTMARCVTKAQQHRTIRPEKQQASNDTTTRTKEDQRDNDDEDGAASSRLADRSSALEVPTTSTTQ